MENRLAELWSIMDFLNPGLLGSSERFRTRYAIPIERHGHTEPAERLRASTRPYILRRLKTDPAIIDDLPEKIEIKQYCQLTTEQASLYQAVVADMMEKIENTEGIERRGNVLAAMAKLKQVCNHPAQLLHDRSPVGRRVREGDPARGDPGRDPGRGRPGAVFYPVHRVRRCPACCTWRRFGRAARDIAYLHGGTPRKRRDEMVARFQSGDGPPIFLLSLKAGVPG
ncbi:helicase helZ [Mycobacterium tuberculosis CAS/NITR204]|uniref:Helicase helZ n=1 Tax=Mycobacterium tuberculosis CAS/NITR204 TaxID=1310114 RepID=R4MF36_MYCTX|nr:helicase helZ [Mycobacterium tuberculosis CAS/NITR204]